MASTLEFIKRLGESKKIAKNVRIIELMCMAITEIYLIDLLQEKTFKNYLFRCCLELIANF